MSEPARKRYEEGAVREARRPFSSFIRRLFSGPDEVEERPSPDPAKVQPAPEERPDEFWHPGQGAPPTQQVRPMRPQFPVWKKDIPGLTDPFLDQDEWQDPWLKQQQRRRAAENGHNRTASDDASHPEELTGSTVPTQNAGFPTLSMVEGHPHSPRHSQPEPTSTMDQPERQENLDAVVDRLLRDKDFLLAEELKHKAEEINQLLVQAQLQKMKVELEVSELESRPGNKVSWLDVKIFKEI